MLERVPLTQSVAAVSCGVVEGVALLDLDYSEDSTAEVDANVVMTGDGGLVEVQATAERTPLSRASLDELLGARRGRHRAAARRPSRRRSPRPPVRDGPACELVLASRNAHKLRELEGLLEPLELVPLPDDVELPPETGETFADNALVQGAGRGGGHRRPGAWPTTPASRRPRWAARPGVRSARYAGEHASDEENLAKLLREVPADGDTRVAYVCALAYVEPGRRRGAGRGPLRGHAHPRAARRGRLRLRPGVRARRLRRRPHDGRADRRRRRTRSATAAARRGR